MNRASKLLSLVEEILNPEDAYKTDAREKTTSSSAHSKLASEAKRQLKAAGGTEPIKRAAYDYSKGMYKHMNNYLRHGEENPAMTFTKSHIGNLKTLTKSPTQHEFYAYRGVRSAVGSLDEGQTFQDKGFTSASLLTKVAGSNEFYRKNSGGRLFRIHVTPGTKGAYISGHDRVGNDEREFVLHPGTRFRVGKTVTHPSGRTFTELHIHSQED